MKLPLEGRPIIVCVAGPNGAGKTTFYFSHLRAAGLRFVNTGALARELNVDAYRGAQAADSIRRELVAQRESFVFETVFSDPVGDKLHFLMHAIEAGYTVVLCFIGIAGPEVSEERVAMQVSQGGHDVPSGKLVERFPRTLANLRAALTKLPHVWVFDNSNLREPFRLLAVVEGGAVQQIIKPVPRWLKSLLP